MVVEAATIIKQNDGKGGFKYPVKAIRILKANGKSMRESQLINGFALNCVIAMQGKLLFYCFTEKNLQLIFISGMPKQVKNAKIALLDFSLQKAKMKMGVQMLINDPDKLEDMRKRLV